MYILKVHKSVEAIKLFIMLVHKFFPFACFSWGVLFSHPADFTPVCTTELGAVAQIMPEFEKRNTKVIAISCDPVESHLGWIKDIQASCLTLKQYLSFC